MTGFKYEGSDVKKISEQLLGLADLLDGRPPSEKALLLWLSCLEDEVPAWAAISALTDWPKRHSKMPAPADIVKTAREIRERALEKKTHQASASEISVAEVRPADPAIARAVDRSLKAIRDLGARPKDFWEWEGITAIAAGRPLSGIKRRYLETQYGEKLGDPAFLRSITGKVRSRLYLEAHLLKPSDALPDEMWGASVVGSATAGSGQRSAEERTQVSRTRLCGGERMNE